ncbi:hypothetical protein ACFQU7_02730 [Pseudoroseomonas wenyumeiae]
MLDLLLQEALGLLLSWRFVVAALATAIAGLMRGIRASAPPSCWRRSIPRSGARASACRWCC